MSNEDVLTLLSSALATGVLAFMFWRSRHFTLPVFLLFVSFFTRFGLGGPRLIAYVARNR